MPVNSVSVLREQALARATKPFVARGSRAIRCPVCLLAQVHCICAARPYPTQSCALCLLMYTGEMFKPSNTGRLLADVISDNHAFQWERTRHDPQLLALLQDPRYLPLLIFPHEYCAPQRRISDPTPLLASHPERLPLFVILDGTWREARKMFNSPYLASLPVLAVPPASGSDYQLRAAAHSHQLCTVEVGIALLQLINDLPASRALDTYFAHFRDRYLAGRANLRAAPAGTPASTDLFS